MVFDRFWASGTRVRVSLTYTFTREQNSTSKKEGVMPRKLEILEGPSFKHIVFGSGLFSETDWSSRFKMDKPGPSKIPTMDEPEIYRMFLLSAGRVTENRDEFVLIGKMGDMGPPHFYVMHFNCVTRKGTAIEYTNEEFLSFSVIREMLGE